MLRVALLSGNIVRNVAAFDDQATGLTTWDGFDVVYSDTAGIGDTYIPRTGVFTPQAVQLATPTRREELAAQTTLTDAEREEAILILLRGEQ